MGKSGHIVGWTGAFGWRMQAERHLGPTALTLAAERAHATLLFSPGERPNSA
jgi:hypothetical protein